MTLKEFKDLILQINEEYDNYKITTESGYTLFIGEIYINTEKEEVNID